MIDSILNLIPTVMGLGVIDENLNGLLAAMEDMSQGLQMPSLMWYAKMIGLCLALGVGANECYQMMLGRRGMDVMKLVHIVIISLCISSAGSIAKIARQPGKLLEGIAKNAMTGMNDNVMKEEQIVAQLQEDYINKVRESMRQMEQAQAAANAKDADGWIDEIKNKLEESVEYIGNSIKEYTLVLETKICEWISLILRLLGEILLQAIIYGLLVSQRIFMHLLEMVAPVMFAISLSPHFKSAWSQWLSKYISLSLWGFVTYVCMYYAFFIIWYNLKQDQAAYMQLMSSVSGSDGQIAAIGMQAVGSTCMYLIGLLVGVKILSMVPEAASWLIPGGVSSSAGSAAGGTVTAGAMSAGSVAKSTSLKAGSFVTGSFSK
ncbi:MAG: hypothetical protein HDS70_04450 [Bacteroidales bacterium]|nr:hypothetical protein [Bacteroidales bacterium]